MAESAAAVKEAPEVAEVPIAPAPRSQRAGYETDADGQEREGD
jgi:hypothetical protein